MKALVLAMTAAAMASPAYAQYDPRAFDAQNAEILREIHELGQQYKNSPSIMDQYNRTQEQALRNQQLQQQLEIQRQEAERQQAEQQQIAASQEQRAQMVSIIRTTASQVQSCSMAAYDSPEAAPLRVHLPFDVRYVSLQQLNDKSLASKKEIDAIYLLYAKYQACRKMLMENLAPVTPTLVPIFSESFERTDSNILALVNRTISWGDFAQRMQRIATDTNQKVTAESRRIAGGATQ